MMCSLWGYGPIQEGIIKELFYIHKGLQQETGLGKRRNSGAS